jgi:hypothetical protein
MMLAKTPAAVSKRRYRARRRAGLMAYQIVCNEFELIEALLVAGRLTEREALDRHAVERATGEVVSEWAQRWLATAKQ